jgi:predicted enzyme related to lactoylglutathione lyase
VDQSDKVPNLPDEGPQTHPTVLPCPKVGPTGREDALRMSFAERRGMEGNHFHVFVRDLTGALAWFARVWAAEPTYREESMAILQFGPIPLVLDQDEEETVTTIGYATVDCDAAFRTAVDRGAQVIEEPADRSWGVRVAYLKGPGRITLELEQELPKADAGSSDSPS